MIIFDDGGHEPCRSTPVHSTNRFNVLAVANSSVSSVPSGLDGSGLSIDGSLADPVSIGQRCMAGSRPRPGPDRRVHIVIAAKAPEKDLPKRDPHAVRS